MTKRVALKAIGCRTNQQELTTLGFELQSAGFELTTEFSDAEIIVVNTCCVTGDTELKTHRTLMRMARDNPGASMLVTGCLVQHNPQLFKDIAAVRWVVGNADKSSIVNILREWKAGTFVAPLQSSSLSLEPLDPRQTVQNSFRTRFPLKIQEGCDFRCAYCIVPSVRGPSRCVDASQVLAAASSALEAGFKELVITGTHIGQFRDQQGGGVVELLRRLVGLDGSFRIRLSSLDPRELDESLLQMVITEPRICKHLHVSVQSLSAPMLHAMNRPAADVQRIGPLLRELRRELPQCALGGDFIVGYPGEGQEHVDETIHQLQELGFTYGHVFRYSKRPGTPAAQMDNQIAEQVKANRSEQLRAVLEHCSQRFVQQALGTTGRIIVEEGATVRGVTSNYVRIEVEDLTIVQRNRWLDVQCIRVDERQPRSCIARVLPRQVLSTTTSAV